MVLLLRHRGRPGLGEQVDLEEPVHRPARRTNDRSPSWGWGAGAATAAAACAAAGELPVAMAHC